MSNSWENGLVSNQCSKHEDMSSVPRTMWNTRHGNVFLLSCAEETGKAGPWASWLASVAELMDNKLGGRPCLKEGEEQWEKTLAITH